MSANAGAIDVSTFPPIKVRETLGGTALAVDAESGTATLRYVPGEALTNPGGTIFGGYLAGMIDDAAGLVVWFGGGRRPFATAQLSVSYIRAVKPGEPLLATARVTGVGTRQAFVDVTLAREVDGKIVATGAVVQTFTTTPPPASAAS